MTVSSTARWLVVDALGAAGERAEPVQLDGFAAEWLGRRAVRRRLPGAQAIRLRQQGMRQISSEAGGLLHRQLENR